MEEAGSDRGILEGCLGLPRHRLQKKPISEEQRKTGPKEAQTTVTLAAGLGTCGITLAMRSQEALEDDEHRTTNAHRSCSAKSAHYPKTK